MITILVMMDGLSTKGEKAMDIKISLPNIEGDHTITINGDEIAPYNQLALPTETLLAINDFILKNCPSNEYEDLYISIGDEIHYRGGK